MSARYAPRLRIAVEHGYYADARARGLRFTPDAVTAEWLRTNDTIARETGDGLLMFAAQARRAAPPQTLNWQVRTAEPLFANITAGSPSTAQALFHFQASAAQATADGKPVNLHRGATAGSVDVWPSIVPGTLAGLLSAQDQRRPPAFIVSLPAPDLSAADDAPVATWRIAFAARKPIWRYWLLGDWSGDPVRIEDAEQHEDAEAQTGFTEPEPETLINGQQALSIRTLDGVALSERSARRFQLRSRSAAADRVLVKRLPVAGADHFARETIDGVPTLVSEIFVHR